MATNPRSDAGNGGVGEPYGVLLVDDVADLRLMVRLNLEGSGRFKVLAEAADGADGVALAGVHRPDLVLLDIGMPVQGGLEALPLIQEASPDSRIVILSAFEEQRYGTAARDLGAAAYVEKTLPPDQLVGRLVDLMAAAKAP
jgi:DNA-binding NarL/FixJ family response regulator